MDQPVIINDTTRPNGPVTLGALKLNSLVRVSGFRDANGVIHASRLEPVLISRNTVRSACCNKRPPILGIFRD